jgi:ribosomal protein S18 acetylase RimI-like enzyme
MATTDPDAAVLDNWVWHSLTGEQAEAAERLGRAARYRPDVSVFAAIDDDAGPGAWANLARLVGPGGHAVLFRAEVEAPAGWTVDWGGGGRQMVLPALTDLRPAAGLLVPADLAPPDLAPTDLAPPDLAARPAPTMDGLPVRLLGSDDVPAMLELTGRTRPGPFLAGTATLGAYLGVHDHGRLVAMAGERSRPPGWVEISAVCTDDAYRGRGLAAGLVTVVARGIFAQGRRAMLHVAADNHGAERVYTRLGFALRRSVDVMRLVAPGL